MSAPLLHLGATVSCSHGGQAMPAPTDPRVTVSGQPVVTLATLYTIGACGSDPPCVTGHVLTGALRVLAGGTPVATMVGQSVCVPTGAPMLPTAAQTRVLA